MSFPPETPTDSFHYTIEAQIGSGSMGVVYRARDLRLERPVAIKTLRQSVLAEEPPAIQQEMRRRFLREARAAARLSHPGITVVYHVDEEEGSPYMVMEWLEGRTLELLLAERPQSRLEIGEATHLATALLHILASAHREGVVHRDIKPANLMILKDGQLKVTDFGIALVTGQDLVQTKAGVVLATPRFASPEQLRGDHVDARSDLFSTGVLLYHMLTGTFPFSGQSFLSLANSIMMKPPVPLREHLPDVPAALEAVLRRALEKSVQDRYASALEMAESLHHFVTGKIDLSGTGVAPHLQGPSAEETEENTAYLQIYRDLPSDPRLALARIAGTWPVQELGPQDRVALLERLLDKPLHAPAFAGAAQIADVCFFIEDGVLLGAVDTATGEAGDAVAERLAQKASARLHSLPSSGARAFPPRFVSLLTTVLHPPRRRQSDLDSTVLNLPAFAAKLEQEKFDGILHLCRGPAWARLIFAGGERVMNLFSGGWDDVPIEQNWLSWVARYPVIAHVEEKVTAPLGFWYRHSHKDFELDIRIERDKEGSGSGLSTGTTGSRIRELFRSPKHTSSLGIRLAVHPASRSTSVSGYERSPSYELLIWCLKELPRHFAERDKAASWKYLVGWLPLARKAILYHELPRGESRHADFFDLVTTDEKGKVLHVAGRVARATPSALQTFLERVRKAKQARTKTGDIGGAFFVAPEFDDETLTLYNETIQKQATGSFLGLEEALTGYEGFVRMGPRRGFHLLLVEEKEGIFEPLIPS